jgi:hypothetical protein
LAAATEGQQGRALPKAGRSSSPPPGIINERTGRRLSGKSIADVAAEHSVAAT